MAAITEIFRFYLVNMLLMKHYRQKHGKILNFNFSCSVDKTVRFWNLNGQYLATLGCFKKWIRLIPDQVVPKTIDIRIPPDIKRIASDTTLKVIFTVKNICIYRIKSYNLYHNISDN